MGQSDAAGDAFDRAIQASPQDIVLFTDGSLDPFTKDLSATQRKLKARHVRLHVVLAVTRAGDLGTDADTEALTRLARESGGTARTITPKPSR